jgi:hypothetical protein
MVDLLGVLFGHFEVFDYLVQFLILLFEGILVLMILFVDVHYRFKFYIH